MNDTILTAEITLAVPEIWNKLLLRFSDSNIYQTWEYGDVRWNRKNLQHVILKKDGDPVAVCQLALMKIWPFPVGIAYVPWGPLWFPHGCEADPEHFHEMIRVLKKEFAVRRKLALRIDTGIVDDSSKKIPELLRSEGFYRTSRRAYTTIIMDLSDSIDTIRKGMEQKWRGCLHKAERSGLTIEERTDPAAFDIFLSLLSQMIERKKFESVINYHDYKKLFNTLPAELNMRLILCKKDNEPMAAVIYTKIGMRAIYILGATGDNALQFNCSNLLQLEVVKKLKAEGCTFYDLGGVNPVVNPGVFHFKKGLAGKNGTLISHIGEYEYCENPLTHWCIAIAEKLRAYIRGRKRNK